MSTTERDTHFAGFARLLWEDLLQANGGGYIDVNTDDDPADGWFGGDSDEERPGYLIHIARAVYDLVQHTIEHIKPEVHEGHGATWESATDIPDMTAWPEQRG